MEFSKFPLLICFLWSLFVRNSFQLQSSQTEVLMQLRKQLEYPKVLDYWLNPDIDLCLSSSPQVNITCQVNTVTEINIFGDRDRVRVRVRVSNQTLTPNFSIDSLIATLSRLNSLRVLNLVALGIWGPVPYNIYRLQSLEHLDFSWNFIYGSVPPSFSRLTKLRILKLDGNLLNGTVPGWFDSLPSLASLSLRNNLFRGPLPSSTSRMKSLTDINLSNNMISGKLQDLSELSSLHWADFSNNKLESELPKLPKGVVVLLLRNNSFYGRIPEQYGKLDTLRQLDLSLNNLRGILPTKLFSLPSIASLNLSSNMLTGSLPLSLSCSRRLQSVDISHNKFIGVPPPSCLSSNVAKIDGNCLSVDVRHQHPETYCKERGRERKKSRVGILLGIIGAIAIVVAILAFGFLVVCRRYRRRRGISEQQLLHKAVEDKSVTGSAAQILLNARFISDAAKFEWQSSLPPHRLFSVDELNAATNNFDKTALIGEGSNGKLYAGTLENGARVAIRCLAASKKYTTRNLKLRLDLLAKLRHPNLVCMLGHCIESEGKDECDADQVYLVYEYVPNGNYLARISESSDSEKLLRWSDRLAILLGIAKAVHFLHTGVIPGCFNNRLKANNILLNEHRIGKLSDYGLSVVVQEIDNNKEEDGLAAWQMKSLEDDVYSFGLILLESLIGPSVHARKESFLLHEMVSLGNPDGQRRIVDPVVLTSCSQESLSIVVSLTINCLSPESSTRPSFEDILWNLQYAAQVQATTDGPCPPANR